MEPGSRHFVEEMSLDPVRWVGQRLSNFEQLLKEADVSRDQVSASDVSDVQAAAGEIVDAVRRLLDRVRRRTRPATRRPVLDAARVSWL
jgi:hypothetical protein